MKKLIQITAANGVIANIAFYADTPNKNYHIYYCGSDTGERFERFGNASRWLERLRKAWIYNNVPDVKQIFGTKNEIPRRGSNA